MQQHPAVRTGSALSIGERLADTAVKSMGSWAFIMVQTALVSVWMALNTVAWLHHWDPAPFIMLNLAFSTQAAYAAPLVLLAQRRTDARGQEVALHTMNAVDVLAAKVDELKGPE